MSRPPGEPAPIGESRLERNQKRAADRIKKKLVRLSLLLIVFVVLASILIVVALPKVLKRRPAPIVPLFSITGLSRPLAVSTDANDRLYVSDTGSGRLLVFKADGRPVGRLGGPASAARFKGLFGAKADLRAGAIYAADWKERAVGVFTFSGRPLRRFPKKPLDSRTFGPRGFTPFGVDIYQNKVYVTSNDGLYIFSKTGRLLAGLKSGGKKVGGFAYPTAVVVDKNNGAIYMADQLNRRVVALSPKGKVKWVLGRAQDTKGFFGLPRGLAVDSRGRVYIVDTFKHSIAVVNKAGDLISVFGKRGTARGEFNFPEGLAINSRGQIYLADRENNRIQVLAVGAWPRPSKTVRLRYLRSFFEPD